MLEDSSKVSSRNETRVFVIGEKTLKNPFEKKFDKEKSLNI